MGVVGQTYQDLTPYLLQNALFDTEYDYTAGETGNVAQEMLPVEGWTNDYKMNYTIVGQYEIGTAKTYNGAAIPAKNVDGTAAGGVLALSTGWGESLKLFQTVTLPAGKYRLVTAYYNGDASKSGGESLFGWVPDGGTATMSKVTSFAVGRWVTDTLAFTLTATTTGRVQTGFKAAANASTNSAKIAIDYVKLLGADLAADNTALLAAITSATATYGDGTGTGAAALKAAISKAQGVADNSAATYVELLGAVKVLETAVETFCRQNISEKNPLDVTAYISDASFEKSGKGWTIDGMQFQGNSVFKQKAGTYYIEKWSSSGAVGDCSVRQTITDLPIGVYKLTVGAQNLTESSVNKQNAGVYIFAGDQQTAVYTPADYSVKFTNITGEAEIGFVAKGAEGNWIAADNFRLYQIGEMTTDDMMGEVQRIIATIEQRELPGVVELPQDVQAALDAALAKAKALDATSTEADIRAAVKQLLAADAAAQPAIERAILAYNIAHATPGEGTAPKVTFTHHYVATGATQALMRAAMVSSNLLERGVCWSTEHNPTVLDNRTTKNFSLKGLIFHLTGLQPATVYYLRPYVMNKTYEVAYGDEVKIVTHPQGTCTGSWDEGAPDEAANGRCRRAIKETIDYFNEWTGINGFQLSGHYGAQTPTADCSYGGWMRIGPNAGNQAIGTVLHETGHGVGVGTHWRWYDCSDTRENTSRGKWLGREANQVLRFLENCDNEAVFFTGDQTHGWGTLGANATSVTNASISYDWLVNGADKDKHDELQYIGGMCILHGLFIDGLCPTSADANGIAGYTYNFDDDKKYYLMSKDKNRGLGTGLLGQCTTSAVGWKPNLGSEAVSDSMAWRMEFLPAKGYYLFKNVATGRYLSHNTSVATRNIAKPTVTEYFQLMPDRTDVVIGTGSKAVTTHGYWFTWEDNVSKALSVGVYSAARGFGGALQADFDFSDAATAQQLIIISEDELPAYRDAAIATAISEVNGEAANADNADKTFYDLQGRRVATPAKGLYIVGGKKVVVR